MLVPSQISRAFSVSFRGSSPPRPRPEQAHPPVSRFLLLPQMPFPLLDVLASVLTIVMNSVSAPSSLPRTR